MKIAIDGRSLLEKQWGGVSVYTSKMIHSIGKLMASNADVRVFLSGKNISLPPNYTPPDNILFKQFNVPNKLLNLSSLVLNAPQMDKLLFQSEDANITWLPNWNYTKTKSPYILTVHDLSIIHHPEWYTKKQQLWHKAINLPMLCKNAERIIAVSRYTAEDVVETLKIPESKISIIHEGVSRRYVPQENEQIRDKYNLPDKFILVFGGGGKRKNLEIISYIKKLVNIPVITTGTKELPYLPEKDKRAVLSMAWCLLYPSLFEGFGLPVLEAMASGTPVVTSNVTSLPELVGDAGLLISPFQIKQWADAINELNSDNDLYITLRLKGINRAKEFTWDNAAKKWWSVVAYS
jgi:glycosyltransferase involved in cell wall biosynthesis